MPKRPPSLTGNALKRKWSATSRKSRHERGYDWQWEKTRARILKRDRYLCQLKLSDKCKHVATEVDHTIPKSLAGRMTRTI